MELFRVESQQGNEIALTVERWNHVLKHRVPRDPHVLGDILRNPLVVVASRTDDAANLYFGEHGGGYIAVVVDEQRGFIKTAYKTDSIKEGETVWKR